MPARVYPLTTDSAGDASVDIRLYGAVEGIGIRLGTLSTPDIDVTDGLTSAVVLSVNGLAADTRYIPRVLAQDESGADIANVYVEPVITGRLSVVVAGGGANKAGEIVVVHS